MIIIILIIDTLIMSKINIIIIYTLIMSKITIIIIYTMMKIVEGFLLCDNFHLVDDDNDYDYGDEDCGGVPPLR